MQTATLLCLATLRFLPSLPAEEVTVQVTSFQVPQLTLGLEALGLAIEQDAVFYDKLVRLASHGEAEIVLDHRWSARSGERGKSGAVTEFIYPTMYEPGIAGFLLCPVAFETRELGTIVEAEAYVGRNEFSLADWQGRPSRMMDFILTASRVRPKGFNLIRVANTQWPGSVSGGQFLPNFLTEKLLARAVLFNGQPMLISATGPTDVEEHRSLRNNQQVILTFARTSTAPSDAPLFEEDDTNRPSAPLRLHGVTLRMPRITAARALWNNNGGPADVLLAEGLRQVKENKAFVLSHAAVATTSGNRAAISSGLETTFASSYDRSLLPHTYETRNTGTNWSVEPTIHAVTHTLDVAVGSDETSLPIWRGALKNRHDGATDMDLPDFMSFVCRTFIQMGLGETRLIGAVTPTPDQVPDGIADDWIDMAFLQTAPVPRRLGAIAVPGTTHNRLLAATFAVFSVDEGQAGALGLVKERAEQKPKDIALAIQELWDAAAEGEVSLTAFASLTQRSGNSSRIWAVREWATLTDATFEQTPPNADILPSKATVALKAVNSGTSWDVLCVEDGDGGSIDLKFVHDVAPPVLAPFEAGTAPRDEDKNTRPQATAFAFSIEAKTRYTSGLPQLLAIEKSPAPSGHPEHGRWLVAVLKVTKEE